MLREVLGFGAAGAKTHHGSTMFITVEQWCVLGV